MSAEQSMSGELTYAERACILNELQPASVLVRSGVWRVCSAWSFENEAVELTLRYKPRGDAGWSLYLLARTSIPLCVLYTLTASELKDLAVSELRSMEQAIAAKFDA